MLLLLWPFPFLSRVGSWGCKVSSRFSYLVALLFVGFIYFVYNSCTSQSWWCLLSTRNIHSVRSLVSDSLLGKDDIDLNIVLFKNSCAWRYNCNRSQGFISGVLQFWKTGMPSAVCILSPQWLDRCPAMDQSVFLKGLTELYNHTRQLSLDMQNQLVGGNIHPL